MLIVSCLLAAAITSHCISLFYGHEQLWNSLSPFWSVFGNISQRFIYNLRARPVPYCGRCVHCEYAMIHQLTDFKKRSVCVVAVSMDLCAQLTYVAVATVKFSKALHFFMTPAAFLSFSSSYREDILNFVYVPLQYCGFSDHIYRKAVLSGGVRHIYLFYCLSIFYN